MPNKIKKFTDYRLMSIFLLFLFLSANAFAARKELKVVMVVLDGVRNLEISGKATDDQGKPVSAKELFPNLTKLMGKGVYFPNMKVSNPVGISLPAYTDIFTGRRQEKILNNEPAKENFYSDSPTIFEAVKSGLKLKSDGVALISSWEQLCPMATQKDKPSGDFFMDCGWKPDKYLKPEVYKGSKVDMDTFVVFKKEVKQRHPRFTFVHFGDADEEAHLQKSVQKNQGVNYGILHYHQALKEEDHYIGEMWKMLQEDPYYRGSTYLIVTTDHGRDNYPDPKQWADHGHCIKNGMKKLCSGCSHVFALVVGPGLKRQVVNTHYSHLDLAPTIANIMGVPFPTAQGTLMAELFSVQETLH